MHIVQIKVNGFKSYRGEVILNLDPGANIIVGRNGSGKSNVYDAIRFVLGDQFGNIRTTERSDLLHDGTSDRVLQASVEITFDNSDGRLPVEAASTSSASSRVTIGRTVGLKKDEYFLNGKAVRKADITNLLEAAGFSKSNPYYIVAQGRVAELASMTDARRLALLKEVAGTQVYEGKRTESLAILQETDARRKEIADTLASLQARLEELAGETADLAAYTSLDRERRALEYCLYSQEVGKLDEELASLAAAQARMAAEAAEGGNGGLEALRAAAADATRRVTEVEAAVKDAGDKLRAAEVGKGTATSSLPKLTHERIRSANAASELQRRVEAAAAEEARLTAELASLGTAMATTQEELTSRLVPAYDAAKSAADAVNTELGRRLARLDELYDLQGRAKRFKSKKERNAYLEGVLADVRAQLSAKEAALAALDKEVAALRKKVESTTATSKKQEAAAAVEVEKCTALEAAEASVVAARDAAALAKAEAWAAHAEAEAEVARLKEAATSAERELHATTALPVRQGLESVRVMATTGAVRGIHGPLIDLFRPVNARYNTAVDVVAGGALFNVVVDNEEVATTVIKTLTRDRGGRVTLMPLSKLAPEAVEYPTDEDCRPLLQFLHFMPEYAKAVQQVFSRVLLCKNLAVAARYARSHGLTCVTLDGDIVNRKGSLQGGHIDHEATRLQHVARMYAAREALEAATARLAEAEKAANEADAAAASLRGKVDKAVADRAKARDAAARLVLDANATKDEAKRLMATLTTRENERGEAAAALQPLHDRIASLEKEMASELSPGLSSAQLAELESLIASQEELRARAAAAQRELDEARQARTAAETRIANNLAKREKEVRATLATLGQEGSRMADDLRAAQRAAEAAAASEEAATAAAATAASTVTSLKSAATALSADLDKAKAALTAAEEQLASEMAKVEKLLERRRAALRRKEECAAKLRSIGALSPGDVEAFQAVTRRKELLKLLQEKQEAMKKYTGVNQRAAEQFATFTDQKAALVERQAELDRGNASIRELIAALDRQKDEAIMRTFAGVSRNFKEVFGQLVPKGSATLRIVTDMDEEEDAEELEEAAEEAAAEGAAAAGGKKRGRAAAAAAAAAKAAAADKSLDRLRGLAVHATFTEAGEAANMASLSGGQKALVALALIFAIQRADPAPFYCFDEVDSALDATHRAAVASLIRRQVQDRETPAQFIITTFRPEIVSIAGTRFYGVRQQHKVSAVEEQTKEETLAFIHALLKEESTAPTAGPGADAFTATAGSRPLPAVNAGRKVARKGPDAEVV